MYDLSRFGRIFMMDFTAGSSLVFETGMCRKRWWYLVEYGTEHLILCAGVMVCAWTDLKYGKVRNYWLWLLTVAGVLHAVENAMAVSLEELRLLYGEQGLIVREFSGMVQQIRTNRNVEQVLAEFAGRSGLEDVQNLAEVLGIGKRTGGDLGSIMRHTAEVIRDKMQVKEEIITLTTSRQFEQKIMNMIPFFIIVYVEGSSPGFFDQMYCTGMGRVLMTMCLILYLTAFWLSERILDIEV